MRIARWAARLLNFNYHVEFHAGAHNRVTDALSRLPLPTTTHETEQTDDEIIVQWISTLFVDASAVTKAELQNGTIKDEVLKSVSKYIMSGWPPKHEVTAELSHHFAFKDELSVVDSCIVCGNRFVIPLALQPTLITIACQGHPPNNAPNNVFAHAIGGWWPVMCCLSE